MTFKSAIGHLFTFLQQEAVMTVYRFNLGDLARDRITGLEGIITSRAEHLFGCSRYWLSPREHKDGKVEGGAWFDEESIEVIEAGAIKPKQYRVVDEPARAERPLQRAGGPTSQPSSQTRASEK